MLLQNLSYAFRRIVKNPAFSFVVILTLGLGIGGNTAIFTLVNAILIRPLPVDRPEELVEIYTTDRKDNPSMSSYLDYQDIQQQKDAFRGVVAYGATMYSLTRQENAQVLYGELVSSNYFSVMGIEATHGRVFQEEELTQGAAPTAVISQKLWREQFNAEPGIVGKAITLNGQKVVVVGIAPSNFKGMIFGLSADVWLLIGQSPEILQGGLSKLEARGNRWLFVKGRLQPGVGPKQVQAKLNILASRIAGDFPETNEGRRFVTIPSEDVRLHPAFDKMIVPAVGLLMVVPALVLLIACTNIAGLLLARSASRQKEIAVRLALGARRTQIFRQLITESLALSMAGGALGLLLAHLGVQALLQVKPPLPLPIALDLALDNRVLVFTALLSLITGFSFGFAPALRVSRQSFVAALKDEGQVGIRMHRRFGLRNILVVTQVAVSLVLLAGAGLLVTSLQRAQSIDPGFASENAIILTPGLWFTNATEEQGRAVHARLIEQIEGLPGIESVAIANRIPLGPQINVSEVEPLGPSFPGESRIEVDRAVVDGGYFEVLQVPILRGRAFSAIDSSSSPRVAIVSETMARRCWEGKEPVGQSFRFTRHPDALIQVVGVARDTKVRTLNEKPRPYVYLPYSQNYESTVSIVARTNREPSSNLRAVRSQVQALYPDLPIIELKTMEDHLGLMLYPPRLGAGLLAAFGTLGVILASMGLYGVVSYAVEQRSFEIGLRMALGARRSTVVAMIVKEATTLIATGLIAGLVFAWGAMKPLAAFLYGARPVDPVVLLGLSLALVGVTMVASYLPARRAVRVDPGVILRGD